jgi:hypothetical protein
MKTAAELVRLFVAERLAKVPKLRMDKAEKEGRLSELRMIQVLCGKPTGEEI